MDPPFIPELPQARAFLEAWLCRACPDLALLGRGAWSRAYRFSLDGREVVARFGSQGEDFAKDRLMARIPHPGVPIPAVLASRVTPWGFVQVAERVSGRFLDDLEAASLGLVMPTLLTVLDALGAVNVPGRTGFGLFNASGRAPYGSWAEALLAVGEDDTAGRIHGWRSRLAATPTGPEPFSHAFATLRRLASDLPNESRVVHQDLLHENVFVAGPDITGVIDWGNALFGDPLYDVASLLYWLPESPRAKGFDVKPALQQHWEASGLRPYDAGRRLLACQLHIGLEAQAYNAWCGRVDQVERWAARTLEIARGAG